MVTDVMDAGIVKQLLLAHLLNTQERAQYESLKNASDKIRLIYKGVEVKDSYKILQEYDFHVLREEEDEEDYDLQGDHEHEPLEMDYLLLMLKEGVRSW
eukprot:g6664.t1